ncbi:MAG: metallophosphoesterase family protein, partial [Treponema sp.]|nr:metallophosphoesterase family protein [Treponema sp.]
EFKTSDAVLFAGDFAECFKTETAGPVLEKLSKKHDVILSVLGNCDEPEFIEKLEDADMNCERTIIYHDGIAFCGSGGGSVFTGKTPNERKEEELVYDFDICKTESLDNLILISHNPPKDTICDAVNENLHAGSQMLRDLIIETKPLAVVTGHIHEGRGIDKINNTLIINPGSFGENGTYAVMEVLKQNGKFVVTNTELKTI